MSMADGWAHYGSAPYGAASGAVPVRPRPLVAVVEGRAVNGALTGRLGPPTGGAAWLVRRITVSTPGYTGKARAYVYVGEVAPENLVMGTRSGGLDVAVEDPPLFIPESSPLVMTWDVGPTRAIARIEYQEA